MKSKLVVPRSTYRAKHSRVYSSTTDSRFNWMPLVVLSKTKSQHHTSFGFSARHRRRTSALD